jgi:hypothetical protein
LSRHQPLVAGAVELRNSISRRFELDLPATLMFDYPSVTAIAGYLVQQLSDSTQSLVHGLSAAGMVGGDQDPTTAIVGVSARYPGQVSGACCAALRWAWCHSVPEWAVQDSVRLQAWASTEQADVLIAHPSSTQHRLTPLHHALFPPCRPLLLLGRGQQLM